VLGPQAGWRVGFLLGALLAAAILLVRRDVPESPRWLISHGRVDEARAIIERIEAEVLRQHGRLPEASGVLHLAAHGAPTLKKTIEVLLRRYPTRSLVGFALMVSQAFFYNAIFFTYALVLTRFYGVAEERVALYIFPFALGNVLGPFILGPLFDVIGRRVMISATYALSGIALLVSGWAFLQGWLDATGQAWAWAAVFFLASAAASSAYLTVSEVFPLEMRALAISVFYAIGTGMGGFVAPALFGALIETGSRGAVFAGYAIGSALVLVAAAITLRYAVDAERKPLEEVAAPLGKL
jgi:MFS family permease